MQAVCISKTIWNEQVFRCRYALKMLCICVEFMNQESLLYNTSQNSEKQIVFNLLWCLSLCSFPLWLYNLSARPQSTNLSKRQSQPMVNMIPLLSMINKSYGTPMFKNKTKSCLKNNSVFDTSGTI